MMLILQLNLLYISIRIGLCLWICALCCAAQYGNHTFHSRSVSLLRKERHAFPDPYPMQEQRIDENTNLRESKETDNEEEVFVPKRLVTSYARTVNEVTPTPKPEPKTAVEEEEDNLIENRASFEFETTESQCYRVKETMAGYPTVQYVYEYIEEPPPTGECVAARPDGRHKIPYVIYVGSKLYGEYCWTPDRIEQEQRVAEYPNIVDENNSTFFGARTHKLKLLNENACKVSKGLECNKDTEMCKCINDTLWNGLRCRIPEGSPCSADPVPTTNNVFSQSLLTHYPEVGSIRLKCDKGLRCFVDEGICVTSSGTTFTMEQKLIKYDSILFMIPTISLLFRSMTI